jgi:hypothetical protein
MANQSYGSAPSRNSAMSSGTMQTKIPLPTPHASTVTADNSGKAPPSSGSNVQGFSGTGTLKGYVK